MTGNSKQALPSWLPGIVPIYSLQLLGNRWTPLSNLLTDIWGSDTVNAAVKQLTLVTRQSFLCWPTSIVTKEASKGAIANQRNDKTRGDKALKWTYGPSFSYTKHIQSAWVVKLSVNPCTGMCKAWFFLCFLFHSCCLTACLHARTHTDTGTAGEWLSQDLFPAKCSSLFPLTPVVIGCPGQGSPVTPSPWGKEHGNPHPPTLTCVKWSGQDDRMTKVVVAPYKRC